MTEANSRLSKYYEKALLKKRTAVISYDEIGGATERASNAIKRRILILYIQS